MITERRFNANSIKFIPHYTLYNKDRDQVIGGGVAIFVRNDIKSIEICDTVLTQVNSEQIWCNVSVAEDSILIGCIYRPPFSKFETSEDIIRTISHAKKLVDNNKYNGLLIAGDFNYPSIKWLNLHGFVKGNNNAGVVSSKFIFMLEDNFLVQHVKEPTLNKNLLNLVISNEPDRIYEVQVRSQLSNSKKISCMLYFIGNIY